MEAMLGISLHSYFFSNQQNAMFFLIIAYIFSPTKSENKQVEQVLPGNKGG
jgi:hypothetical protein